MRARHVREVPLTSRRAAEYSIAGGAAALFVVTAVAPGLGVPTRYTVMLVALITAAASVGIPIPAAVSIGGIGWLFLTGFVVNENGELRIHGLADWLRLALLLGVAALVSHATRARTGTAAEARPDA